MLDESSVQHTYNILVRQLNNFWPTDVEDGFFSDVKNAICKTKYGWNESTRTYYLTHGFSVLNTAVYSVFLYNLAHAIGVRGNVELADKIYYLNKIMNGVEWYWNIELPDHFIVEHPLHSVLGKAVYGDYFSIYQGVTVGERLKEDVTAWPVIGDYVIMFANSSLIGSCNIGNRVIISANTFIKNEEIPDCSIVFGNSPNLIIKRYDKNSIKKYFIKSWRI